MKRFQMLRLATLVASTAAFGTAASAQDIQFGAILPLTGPGAVVGLAEQQGIEAAVATINEAGGIAGRTVSVVYDDSQGKADLGILAFNKQTTLDNVPAVIGAYSGPTIAMAPLAARKKVLLLNPAAQSNSLADASPFLFNTVPMSEAEVSVIADYAFSTLGAQTAAVIYENSAAGIDSLDDFKRLFSEAGGSLIAEEPVQFGDTNFRPSMIKVAAAAPDVVFVSITQGHTSFADQVGQQENFPPIIGTTYLTPAMGHAASDGWFNTSIEGTLTDEQNARFKSMFGIEQASFFNREYYNAMMILAETSESLIQKGEDITGANLRSEVLEIGTFGGIATLIFDDNNAERAINVMTVHEGAVVPADMPN